MWSWLNTASRRLEHYGSSPVVLGNQNNEGNPSVRGGTGQDDHYPEGRKEIEGVQERRKDREEERKREKFYPFATPKSRQRFPGPPSITRLHRSDVTSYLQNRNKHYSDPDGEDQPRP